LTEEVFKKYMYSGLGRCYTVLKEAPDISLYKNTVLEGCLTSLSYDMQSEGTRAKYIFVLTQFFSDDNFFLLPLTEKFATQPTEDDSTFAHMAELLSLFLKKGSIKAMVALLSRYEELLSVLKSKRDFEAYDFDRDCLERLCIILIAPSPELFFAKIADDLGALFIANPAYSREDFEFFTEEAENLTGKSLEALTLGDSSENIKSFMRAPKRSAPPPVKSTERVNEGDIFDLILGDTPPTFAEKRRFIRRATGEMWQRLNMMSEMISSSSLKAEIISLYSAAEKEYHNPPALIEYAESGDTELSLAALEALVFCRGTLIADYAAERLIGCRHDEWAVRMLIRNADTVEGDILALVLSECECAPWDNDTRHTVCGEIVSASERGIPISRAAMLFAYENTPCSRCRLDALRELIRRKMADAEILRECLYDSDEDVRALAKANKQ